MMLDVLGEIYRGHAALTELALEGVAVGQGRSKARRQVAQWVLWPKLRISQMSERDLLNAANPRRPSAEKVQVHDG